MERFRYPIIFLVIFLCSFSFIWNGLNSYCVLLTGIPLKNLQECFRPGSGGEVLPANIRTAIAGLNELRVSDYRIDGYLQIFPDMNPRLTEGAWPVRHLLKSRTVVGYFDDLANNPLYRILWRRDPIAIAYCSTGGEERVLTPLDYDQGYTPKLPE